MIIGLAYALPGEIRSILKTAEARLLETVCGADIYEIEPGLLAYVGGVGKVNAAMSTQLFIDRYHPDWIVNAGAAESLGYEAMERPAAALLAAALLLCVPAAWLYVRRAGRKEAEQ